MRLRLRVSTRSMPSSLAAMSASRPGHDRIFGIELALVAETAADIGRDNPHRALRDAELLGHQPPDVMRHLSRGVERELRCAGAAERECCARLDGRPDKPVVDQL